MDETRGNVWSDYEAMLRDIETDAIVIATPGDLRKSMGMAELEAGSHAFIEKSITNTASKADALELDGHSLYVPAGFGLGLMFSVLAETLRIHLI